MDTLHLSPRLRFPVPVFMRWVVIGFSFLLAGAVWWVNDLWRVATWSTHQLEIDDGPERPQLLAISLFAGAIAAGIAVAVYLGVEQEWHWYERVMLLFPLSFLYIVTTVIRLSR